MSDATKITLYSTFNCPATVLEQQWTKYVTGQTSAANRVLFQKVAG